MLDLLIRNILIISKIIIIKNKKKQSMLNDFHEFNFGEQNEQLGITNLPNPIQCCKTFLLVTISL